MTNHKVFVNHSIITRQWKQGLKATVIILFSAMALAASVLLALGGIALAYVIWFLSLGHINFVTILADYLKDENMNNTWMVKNVQRISTKIT